MTACMNCGSELEFLAGPHDRGPKVDDFVMCEFCGHMQCIASPGEFRRLTPREKKYVDARKKNLKPYEVKLH